MRSSIVLILVLLIAAAAPAQGLKDSSSVVSVSAPSSVRASVGSTLEIPVEIRIDKGWHLYAHGDTAYYGIAVAGLDTVPLAAVKVDYPAGRLGEFLGYPVRLLEGAQTLTLRGVLMSELDASLRFELECQACDDRSCLAPAWIPFETAVLPEE